MTLNKYLIIQERIHQKHLKVASFPNYAACVWCYNIKMGLPNWVMGGANNFKGGEENNILHTPALKLYVSLIKLLNGWV